jgi:NarL family two-component system response regulator LiaR
MTSVLLIDDHPLAVNGIGAWLTSLERFTIAGTAGTVGEAQALLESLDPFPQALILDIALGTENGLAVIPAVKKTAKKRKAPLPGIVVCSMYEDPFLIQTAMDAGAGAYITKTADFQEIVTAIDAVRAGKTYINPAYQMAVRKWASSGLSRREREIVALIKRSLSNKKIAKNLEISVRTVENHLSDIYVKTNVWSRAELAEL